jgi:hypothetical protein
MIIPPETHFFHSNDVLNQKFKSDSSESFRDRLIRFWYSDKTRIKDLGLDEETVSEQAKELDLKTPEELFTLQLTMYRKERGKKMIGASGISEDEGKVTFIIPFKGN